MGVREKGKREGGEGEREEAREKGRGGEGEKGRKWKKERKRYIYIFGEEKEKRVIVVIKYIISCQDEFSRLVEKWNAQRAQAVAHALLKVLYPLMEKEMRNKLLLEAKEHVLQVRL